MACPCVKRLCNNLVVSTAVTFADDTLTIQIPEGIYNNGDKYCVVVAQSIPTAATINAPVAIAIGTDTTVTYPLLNPDCSPVTACAINSRTRYSTKVRTTATTGSFVLCEKLPCTSCANNLASIPAPVTPAPTT